MPSADADTILIISHEFDPHVDQMLVLLRSLGVECVRWLPNAFPHNAKMNLRQETELVNGKLETALRQLDLRSVRSVWYRHPAGPALPAQLEGDERRFADAEARAALSGMYQLFDWFWVNHPDRIRVAASKTLQLKLAGEIGLKIPRTLITNDPAAVREFFEASNGDIVYKPFNSGFFVGTANALYTSPVTKRELEKVNLIADCPGIFQENIAKKIELRITVIGTRVFAVAIHSQASMRSSYDWRRGDIDALPHEVHTLPSHVEKCCLELIERCGLAYGAIDMIVTPDDDYVFLENNPGGQFGWIESKTGLPLTETLARMLVAGCVL